MKGKFLFFPLLSIVTLAWGAPDQQHDQKSIETKIQSRWPVIQACYESQVAQGAVSEGKIVVGFKTDALGYVKKTWINSSTLDNKVVQRCVMYSFKKLKFRLQGQKPIKGYYPISFSLTNLQKPVAKPILTNDEKKQIVDMAIQENWPKFRKCYIKEKIINPNLRGGEILVAFQINEKGRIDEAMVQKSTLENEPIESCIIDRFKSIRFDNTLSDKINGIYPITFKVEK